MERKKKICIASLSVLALVVCFGLGFFIGQKCKCCKGKKGKYVSFYSVKKHMGKEMDDKEKKVIRLFMASYEECLANNLDVQEKEQLANVQNEVLALAEGNSRIKFDIMKLKSVKNNPYIVKKVRKCQKGSYKHLTKEDRRYMRSGLSKANIRDVIAMFHGVR